MGEMLGNYATFTIILMIVMPILGYILASQKDNLFAKVIGITITVIWIILLLNMIILGGFIGSIVSEF